MLLGFVRMCWGSSVPFRGVPGFDPRPFADPQTALRGAVTWMHIASMYEKGSQSRSVGRTISDSPRYRGVNKIGCT
jgi:hypothetical protein